MRNDYVYDIETYPNVFTLAIKHAGAGFSWQFEISDNRNDSVQIIEMLYHIKDTCGRMVGFNNLSFDYPVLHTLLKMGRSDAATLYRKAQAIIDSMRDESDNKFLHAVYPSDRFVPQVDLFKIHHFDNKAKSTSLKMLEFNMRLSSIQELPFPVGQSLTAPQIKVLRQYNLHDVDCTLEFYHQSLPMLDFREQLTVKYGTDFTNHNDTKIGKDYFIMQLEASGIECYTYGGSGRSPRQTLRPSIDLRDAILPWIEFEQPEFRRVLDWLKAQTITETKGVFDNVIASIGGFEFVFGLGGIHGSVESTVVQSNDEHIIIDLDVTSYYPNLAITNGFYPAHLGKQFCDIYRALFEQRKQYPKKSAESAMLKLALNGVYGDSNNKFSVFYDPMFTMKITLNGQVLLCLLAENLMKIPGLSLVQVNTDGVTVRLPKHKLDALDATRRAWEQHTGLSLEQADYSRMYIRDVNNYIAVFTDGRTKRKGAYEYSVGWHQNAGGLVIPKVAEKVLVDNAPIRSTVENWPDKMDFMLRSKVPRSSYLLWGDERVQNVSRYYIAHGGKALTKRMPPLKGKTDWRSIGIESGWTVQVCNNMSDATLPVNYDYYIREVEKLCLTIA
jgi:hypothetical protein